MHRVRILICIIHEERHWPLTRDWPDAIRKSIHPWDCINALPQSNKACLLLSFYFIYQCKIHYSTEPICLACNCPIGQNGTITCAPFSAAQQIFPMINVSLIENQEILWCMQKDAQRFLIHQRQGRCLFIHIHTPYMTL